MMTTAATRVAAQGGLRAGAATMKGGVVRPAVATTMMTIAADRGVVVMAVGSGTRRAIPRPASVAGRNGVNPAAAVGPMTTMTIGAVRPAVEPTMMTIAADRG